MKKIKDLIFQPRFYPFFLAFGIDLLGGAILRVILGHQFGIAEIKTVSTFLKVSWTSLRIDLAEDAYFFLPLVLWLALLPNKAFRSKLHKFFFEILFGVITGSFIFSFIAEFDFFEEFNSRFNTVAVDYLIYPHEVFVNIWESYPVGRIVFLCVLAGLAAAWLCHKLCKKTWSTTAPFKQRMGFLGTYLVISLLFTQTFNYNKLRFSSDRVLDEIASNGIYSFVYAAYTRNLDYGAFYMTLPREEAYARVRRLIHTPHSQFSDEELSTLRTISATPGTHPKNLVILLIESFGSEFWGSLGRKDTLTPYMDKLADEGMLFTNLYASGNRTVRGLEGVLSAFPPLPGDSIVKRHLSDNVSTIARTLKEKKYATKFIYGGRGVFDGMRSFTTRNGFDSFVEEKDFNDPSFKTIWGVADEDLYKRGIEEIRALHKTGQPYFVTMLSVSNHKPYTYPKGRIAEDPDKRSRLNAVKYTDWTLGQFFEAAKKEDFYKDTVFAVVADHGARVYGSQEIPIYSYRIPMLIVGSGITKKSRPNVLGGSLDVGPTVLGLLGQSYPSIFFGRDLLKIPKNGGWAVMNHNRDIGLYENGRMAVLGLNHKVAFYTMDQTTGDLLDNKSPGPEDIEVEKDAEAIFQVADELYTGLKYRTDSSPPLSEQKR